MIFFKMFFYQTLLSLIIALQAVASDYHLFDKSGQPNPKYNEMIRNIHAGDRIFFSNGKVFTVTNILGSNTSSLVLQVAEQPRLALRISLTVDKLERMQQYLNGDKILRYYQVAHVEVFDTHYLEYIFVEKLNNFSSFKDIVTEFSEEKKSSAVDKKKVLNLLIQFLDSIALIRTQMDLDPDNLVFDRQQERWLLLDWNDHIRLARSIDDFYPFAWLIAFYGRIHNDRYHTWKPNHQWLEPSINQAIQNLISSRTNYFSLKCSHIYF